MTVATAGALAKPLDFPALAQAVVPGDRVVLALEAGVPRVADVVVAIVEVLIANGISAADITLLRTENDANQEIDPRKRLPPEIAEIVGLTTHHPGTREELGYLGADESGQPIYVNRLILDADVVIPICCVSLDRPLGYGGVRAMLYPAFGDLSAQGRCRLSPIDINAVADLPSHVALKRSTSKRNIAKRGTEKRLKSANKATADKTFGKLAAISQHEADHIAWLMGVLFAVQVVPGPNDSVLAVLAGHLDAVAAQGQILGREIWSYHAARRAKLVVAAIDVSSAQQTWEAVGRALAAASRVVADGGTIALCTELPLSPGPAFQAVAGADDFDQAQRYIRKHSAPDMPAAEQWMQTLGRAKIYLLSQLTEETVESLGAGYIGQPEEVARLIARAGSCIVLPSAQYVLPNLPD